MGIQRKEALTKIKSLRESKQLSQEQMAEIMKITQSAYARFESGKSKTDLEILEIFCDSIGMSLSDFFIYPDKYEPKSNEIKAQLTIELNHEKKDQVLKLVFGDNNLEILNK